jgi:hypothetical protein
LTFNQGRQGFPTSAKPGLAARCGAASETLKRQKTLTETEEVFLSARGRVVTGESAQFDAFWQNSHEF